MRTKQIGPGCTVLPLPGDSAGNLQVSVDVELPWRVRAGGRKSFPGTAVLYDGDWYEVLRSEPGAHPEDVVYELAPWDESQVIRDTFELSAKGLGQARAQWRRQHQPFSARRTLTALLPALACIVVTNATLLLLSFPPMVWAEAQTSRGLLSPGLARLVVVVALALGLGVVLWEVKLLNLWLVGLNRRYPWLETELWHAHYGILILYALGASLGSGLLWLATGDGRIFGGSLLVASVVALLGYWRDPRLE